jgi:hypothetical protein
MAHQWCATSVRCKTLTAIFKVMPEKQTCGPATLDTCNNNSIQFFILMCCTNSQMANYRYSTNKQNNNNKDKVLVTTSQKTNFNYEY